MPTMRGPSIRLDVPRTAGRKDQTEPTRMPNRRGGIPLADRVHDSGYGRISKLPPSIGRTIPKCLRSRVTTVRV
jgi:hypothetical protein